MTITPKTSPKPSWKAPQTAMLAFAATAAALVAAKPAGDDAWVVPALAVSSGLLAGIFHARRLTALLGGAVAGLVIGLVSSIGLLRYDVVEKFAAVASTIAVSLAMGLLLGAFIELVIYLHRLTHR